MIDPLENLLDTGQDLIAQIEEAKATIDDSVIEINENTGLIDNAIADLKLQAKYLVASIEAMRKAQPHLQDPVAAASIEAIDNLTTLLADAKNHFAQGETTAAYGTLTLFDGHAEDLKAAIRLCAMANRRRRK